MTIHRACNHDSGYDSDGSHTSFFSAISHSPRENIATEGRLVRRKKISQWPKMNGVLMKLKLPCLPTVPEHSKTKRHPSLTGPAARLAAKQGSQSKVKRGRHELTDLGWATCTVDHGESHSAVREIRVAAKGSALTKESTSYTCDFIRNLLTTSDWPYNLTYDFRALPVPTLNFVVKFASLGTEPAIFEISQRRCASCKVLLTPGMKFNMLTVTIAAFFKLMPPVCRTYLLTQDGEPGPDAVFFDPPALVPKKSPATATLEAVKTEVATERQANSGRVQEITDVGWATCSVDHGESDNAVREIRVVAKGSALTNESTSHTCDYIRNLLTTSDWHYNLTYDFRALPVPTLNFVVKFAMLGTEPKIFEISQRRCASCKVILTPGMKFNMLTVTIAAFFKLMPPVCRTYLLTQDGEPGPDAVFFDPPAQGPTKAPATAALEAVKAEVTTEREANSGRVQEITDVGWATCSVDHGEIDNAVREIRVAAKGNPLTKDSTSYTCDFIRNLLTTSDWPYNLTYDFRALPVPTLNFVVKFASLGTEPEIFEISRRRCASCKVLLTPGMKFNMLAVTIAGFFKLMPPVCRTYLLTQDGEPGPDAIFFDPPALAPNTSPATEALEVAKLEVAAAAQHDASSTGTGPTDGGACKQNMLIVHPQKPLIVHPLRPNPTLLVKLSSAAQSLCNGPLASLGIGFAFLTHQVQQPAEAHEYALQGRRASGAILLLGGVLAGFAAMTLLRRSSAGGL